MSEDLRGLVYLITGGSGFLGRHLLRVLLEKEDNLVEIRVFDKHPDYSLKEHSTGKPNGRCRLVTTDTQCPFLLISSSMAYRQSWTRFNDSIWAVFKCTRVCLHFGIKMFCSRGRCCFHWIQPLCKLLISSVVFKKTWTVSGNQGASWNIYLCMLVLYCQFYSVRICMVSIIAIDFGETPIDK